MTFWKSALRIIFYWLWLIAPDFFLFFKCMRATFGGDNGFGKNILRFCETFVILLLGEMLQVDLCILFLTLKSKPIHSRTTIACWKREIQSSKTAIFARDQTFCFKGEYIPILQHVSTTIDLYHGKNLESHLLRRNWIFDRRVITWTVNQPCRKVCLNSQARSGVWLMGVKNVVFEWLFSDESRGVALHGRRVETRLWPKFRCCSMLFFFVEFIGCKTAKPSTFLTSMFYNVSETTSGFVGKTSSCKFVAVLNQHCFARA